MEHVATELDAAVARYEALRHRVRKLSNEWDMVHGIGGDVPEAACRMRRRLLGETEDEHGEPRAIQDFH